MQKISKRQKKELIAVLEKLILIIQKMRKMKDHNILQNNEKDAKEWIDYLLAHDTKEDIDKLYSHVARLSVFVYDAGFTYSELKGADTVIDENFIVYEQLDNKRVELMDEFLWCCNKCVS